ncbi:MAG: O-antigen ligase family protein, partial [Ignavibacteriaceae bacterium]|nr:O-antigen ligase family protein [Ignavibacteriaceae bacterium]
LIKDSSYIKTYVTALVIATAILAISTIYLFIIDGYSLIELNLGLRSRVSGLIGNPNILTNFYIISVPILVLSLMFYRNAIKKSVVVSILILFIVGLTLTISRTAILGVLLSTLFIFFLFRKKYFYWSMFCLVLMVLNILIYEPFGSLTSLLFRLERGLAGREFIWDISIGIIKDNPIFGIGVGVFKLEMFNYFPIMLDSWVGRELVKLHEITATGTNLSHNLFLGFYTDMGIVGFSTAIFFATIFFRTGIKTLIIYKSIDSKDYYLILALFLGGATMFVRALFDSVGILSYGVITSDLPFWLIFGSLLHYYKNHPHNFIKE